MGANETQVGGDHYKTVSGLQHWDLVELNGVGYLEGCATKYLSRWRKKNGLQDLQKALHYTQKLLEMFHNQGRRPRGNVPSAQIIQFFEENGAESSLERMAMKALFQWTEAGELVHAERCIKALIAEEYPNG